MKVIGIEYAGIGTQPYFIVRYEDERVELVPLERGITNLEKEKIG